MPELTLNKYYFTRFYYIFLFYVATFLKRGHHIEFCGDFRRLASKFLN